jgi:hypothetical protein
MPGGCQGGSTSAAGLVKRHRERPGAGLDAVRFVRAGLGQADRSGGLRRHVSASAVVSPGPRSGCPSSGWPPRQVQVGRWPPTQCRRRRRLSLARSSGCGLLRARPCRAGPQRPAGPRLCQRDRTARHARSRAPRLSHPGRRRPPPAPVAETAALVQQPARGSRQRDPRRVADHKHPETVPALSPPGAAP